MRLHSVLLRRFAAGSPGVAWPGHAARRYAHATAGDNRATGPLACAWCGADTGSPQELHDHIVGVHVRRWHDASLLDVPASVGDEHVAMQGGTGGALAVNASIDDADSDASGLPGPRFSDRLERAWGLRRAKRAPPRKATSSRDDEAPPMPGSRGGNAPVRSQASAEAVAAAARLLVASSSLYALLPYTEAPRPAAAAAAPSSAAVTVAFVFTPDIEVARWERVAAALSAVVAHMAELLRTGAVTTAWVGVVASHPERVGALHTLFGRLRADVSADEAAPGFFALPEANHETSCDFLGTVEVLTGQAGDADGRVGVVLPRVLLKSFAEDPNSAVAAQCATHHLVTSSPWSRDGDNHDFAGGGGRYRLVEVPFAVDHTGVARTHVAQWGRDAESTQRAAEARVEAAFDGALREALITAAGWELR